jgi:hypothetical protein
MDNTDDLYLDENLNEISTAAEVLDGPSPTIAPKSGTSAAVVQQYSHCNFCGGRLHFNHMTDFSRNTTHEKASCPECGLEARQVMHRLQ